MPLDLLPYERAALEMLLAGSHPTLTALRSQIETLVVVEREFTGVGFYTQLRPGPGTRPEPHGVSFVIDDVHANGEGLDPGVGFLAHLDHGLVTTLEGFTFGDHWPDAWPADADFFYCEEGRPPLVDVLTLLGLHPAAP